MCMFVIKNPMFSIFTLLCTCVNSFYLFFHSYYTFETKKDSPPHMPTCYKPHSCIIVVNNNNNVLIHDTCQRLIYMFVENNSKLPSYPNLFFFYTWLLTPHVTHITVAYSMMRYSRRLLHSRAITYFPPFNGLV